MQNVPKPRWPPEKGRESEREIGRKEREREKGSKREAEGRPAYLLHAFNHNKSKFLLLSFLSKSFEKKKIL